jgi:hypothetical protein
VRRNVIDVKKISPRVMKPLSQLLIHRDGKKRIFDSGTIRFNSRRQSLIGFSQRDFERGIKSANRQIEPDFKPEHEERGTARGNSRGIRGSIKPKNP